MNKVCLTLVFLLAAVSIPGVGQEAGVEEILDKARQKWKTIRTYHCKMQSLNRLGQEVDKKKLEFWFSRNHQVRMEVLDGENRGAVLTLNDAGKIQAKKGGLLGVIPVTLSQDDDRIRNLRGREFYYADWGSVLKEWLTGVQKGWKTELLPDEVFNNRPCHVISLFWNDPGEPITKDVIYVDQTEGLILRRKQYEGETIVNEVAWWDIELNTPVENDFFEL